MARNKYLLIFGISILALPFFTSGQSITIEATNERQRVEVIGGDVERSQNFVPKAANATEVVKWCFGDIPFNVCRVSYDKRQEMEEGVKNLSFYNDAIKTMKWIKNVNPGIKFLATMKSDYNGFNEGNHNNLPTFIYNYACVEEDSIGGRKCLQSTGDRSFNIEKYGIFLTDYLEHMHKNGLTISYLATAKEWNVITVTRSSQVYTVIKRECQKRNVPLPPIIGPASWGLQMGIDYVNEVRNKGFKNEYYAFSSHNLGDDDDKYVGFVEATKRLGMPAWDDESSVGSGGRTNGEEPDMNETLPAYRKKTLHYAAGYVGEIFFEINSRGVNSETRAVYFRSGMTGKRMRSYYIMKAFTESAIGKNYIPARKTGVPNAHIMSFRKDGNLVVVVVNENETETPNVPFLLEGVSFTGALQQQVWTNDTPITGDTKTIARTGNRTFNATLPGKSISIFRIPIQNGDVVSSTKGLENNVRFTVSPNPLSLGDAFTVFYKQAAVSPYLIQVFDIQGRKIFEKEYRSDSAHIPAKHLAPGVYSIVVMDKNRFGVQRIVKQ